MSVYVAIFFRVEIPSLKKGGNSLILLNNDCEDV